MTDSRQDLEAELDRIGEQRHLAQAALQSAVKATDPAIVRALKAGFGPSEISRRLGITDSYVRKVRRLEKIPADPRYAHLKPPERGAEIDARNEVPENPPGEWDSLLPAVPARPNVPARIADIPLPEVDRLAQLARKRRPDWYAEFARELQSSGEHQNVRPYRVIERALELNALEESDLPK